MRCNPCTIACATAATASPSAVSPTSRTPCTDSRPPRPQPMPSVAFPLSSASSPRPSASSELTALPLVDEPQGDGEVKGESKAAYAPVDDLPVLVVLQPLTLCQFTLGSPLARRPAPRRLT